MSHDEEANEEDLRGRQDGRLYPLGRALRSTYGADNHDTLGSDVTGLMIDLSKVPFEPERPAPVAAPETLSASALRPSIIARLTGLIGWS